MANALVNALAAMLFLLVAGLLAYGVVAFRDDHGATPEGATASVRVNTRREVLWTGISAALLLAVFVFAR